MWGDDARDKIWHGLQSLGVNAHLANRGRPEEQRPWEEHELLENRSLGIIEIADGPIAWVNVGWVIGDQGDGDHSKTDYTDYGVRVSYCPPDLTIWSLRRKTFPLLGAVIDAEWAAVGSDAESALAEDVLRRLREDAQVREAIMATRDVGIIGSGVGWVISTRTRKVPTRQAWDCYQAIARHLIAAGSAEPNAE